MAVQLGDLASLHQPVLIATGSGEAAALLQVDASLDLAGLAQRLGSSAQVSQPFGTSCFNSVAYVAFIHRTA